MIRVNIKREFNCKREELWRIVTDNENYFWRSDLDRIEIVDDRHFVEYAKNNFPTYFTITLKKELEEYQFDLENTNLKGKWTGLFRELPNGKVELDFTEEIEVTHFLMKRLAKFYLKNQQKRYMQDLVRALEIKENPNLEK